MLGSGRSTQRQYLANKAVQRCNKIKYLVMTGGRVAEGS